MVLPIVAALVGAAGSVALGHAVGQAISKATSELDGTVRHAVTAVKDAISSLGNQAVVATGLVANSITEVAQAIDSLSRSAALGAVGLAQGAISIQDLARAVNNHGAALLTAAQTVDAALQREHQKFWQQLWLVVSVAIAAAFLPYMPSPGLSVRQAIITHFMLHAHTYAIYATISTVATVMYIKHQQLQLQQSTLQLQLSTTQQATCPPIGSVIGFAGQGDHTHGGLWIHCDGRELQQAQYPELFRRIGFRYKNGREREGTFNIPDYRGLFLRGVDQGANQDPGAANRINNGEGTPTGPGVGTYQADGNASHTHGVNDPGHTHNWRSNESAGRKFGDDVTVENKRYGDHYNVPGYIHHSHTGITIQASGDESRPKNISVYWVIRIK